MASKRTLKRKRQRRAMAARDRAERRSLTGVPLIANLLKRHYGRGLMRFFERDARFYTRLR